MEKECSSQSDLDESEIIRAMISSNVSNRGLDDEERIHDSGYDVVGNPVADTLDLSKLRGVASGEDVFHGEKEADSSDTDLENLAELVPDVKARRRNTADQSEPPERHNEVLRHPDQDALDIKVEAEGTEVQVQKVSLTNIQARKMSVQSVGTTGGRRMSNATEKEIRSRKITQCESMRAQESRDMDEKINLAVGKNHASEGMKVHDDDDEVGQGTGHDDTSFDGDYPGSDHALDNQEDTKVSKEFMNIGSSAQSISTATQTHEVRMPMYLPTFKPATGCTNASDFIVRCFVARLRSGITVVKHGRSRWCKSRLRVLHIHPDGRSLSWKPAEGEPTSSKRPPKLDLSTCLEVRHAWSPDPQNPMYTGTSILRQKCEAANAHKSFALIFKQRTVDITAVTADQCKVLMEGFSALCFRLQVANLAGRGQKKGHARPMPDEDGVSTTASATLTNTSTPRLGRAAS